MTSIGLTIGNFDGVHRGHAALILGAREAVGPDGSVIVLSFDPHPSAILRPHAVPARLTRFDQRREAAVALGADRVERLVPTPDFLAQTPHQFILEIVRRFNPRTIIEGPDFRFGHARSGTPDTLRQLGRDLGFETRILTPVTTDLADQSIVTVSSSMIRWLLQRGRVADAARLLGRPYVLRGTVVRGDQRGRDIGYPTANLDHGDLLLPADGIYAGTATLPDGRVHPAAISVGTKPTFAGDRPRVCETSIIGWNGALDDYGWTLDVAFHDWLREQVRYDSVDALVEQLGRDVARAASDPPVASGPARPPAAAGRGTR
ncbi:MAG: riboflavin biosynthesis protein RibF [Phycisphaerales bacterium]|nr:riboflavin biosynthesis protein RibF [Phycisphaerales bacterium]